MKAEVLSIDGKKLRTIELPTCFSQEIKEDVVSKVLEAKKSQQPYAPSLIAGKQHSASGKLVHRRHVWKSQYGRGISRIPRKIMSRRGSQFNWEGAEVSSTKGGRRAHPPKVLSMINIKKINKKEMKIAFCSAISATAKEKEIQKRYETLKDEKIIGFPLIADSKLTALKTKKLISSLKKILPKPLHKIAIKKRSVRAGKGKARGRKYKSNAGLLLVIGKDEKLKIKMFDVVNVKNLGVTDLAKGGVGRLTLYTEQAIKDLGGKFK